jgi:hypothetical protein
VVDGKEFDVYTSRGYYDGSTEDAAKAFIRAAKPGQVEPALGWKGV